MSPWSASHLRPLLPDKDPIGRHFNFGVHDREVVGVVGDVRVRGLERASEPQVYLPYKQVPDGWLIGYVPEDLAIHTTQPPLQFISEVRQIIAGADPQQPIGPGLVLAYFAARWLGSLLAGVKSGDLLTFSSATLFVLHGDTAWYSGAGVARDQR